MAIRRKRVLVAAVGALALAQVFFEDVMVFLGLAAGGSSLSPIVFIAIPGAISLLLIAVLLGSALLAPDWRR